MKLPVCRYETTTAHGGLSGFDKQNNYSNSYYTPYGNAATYYRKEGSKCLPLLLEKDQ